MGPRKILAVLEREAPETAWPAASTIGAILKRAGLVTPVKRRRRPLDQRRPSAGAGLTAVGGLQGWFRLAISAVALP